MWKTTDGSNLSFIRRDTHKSYDKKQKNTQQLFLLLTLSPTAPHWRQNLCMQRQKIRFVSPLKNPIYYQLLLQGRVTEYNIGNKNTITIITITSLTKYYSGKLRIRTKQIVAGWAELFCFNNQNNIYLVHGNSRSKFIKIGPNYYSSNGSTKSAWEQTQICRFWYIAKIKG